MPEHAQHILRFLSANDIRKALPMAEAVEAMKRAFARLSKGDAVVPLRTHIEVPSHKGNALFMPSYMPADDRLAIKAVTLFDDNAAKGLPRIQALVLLINGTDGRPLAVMDGASLTASRTGAASGAATDLLARRGAETAAIFGCGVQGRTQLEAVCAVRSIRRVSVFDTDAKRALEFAEEMNRALDVQIDIADSSREAVADADIVCTATTSKTPVFDDADLKPGVHLNAVGSYQPWVQEIPAATIRRARVVVDHRESALAETGDLIIPIEKGLYSEGNIHAEIGEIASGAKPGRTSEEEVTLFKSVGVAVQDLVAASQALQRAEESNLGTEVSL